MNETLKVKEKNELVMDWQILFYDTLTFPLNPNFLIYVNLGKPRKLKKSFSRVV